MNPTLARLVKVHVAVQHDMVSSGDFVMQHTTLWDAPAAMKNGYGFLVVGRYDGRCNGKVI